MPLGSVDAWFVGGVDGEFGWKKKPDNQAWCWLLALDILALIALNLPTFTCFCLLERFKLKPLWLERLYMVEPVVLSSRKVNPLSLASAIRRTAGQNEVRAKIAQYETQAQQVRKVAQAGLIAQQSEHAEIKAVSIFPHVSTLAMMQLVPMRPVSTARILEYEAMAERVAQDDAVSIGKGLDIRA